MKVMIEVDLGNMEYARAILEIASILARSEDERADSLDNFKAAEAAALCVLLDALFPVRLGITQGDIGYVRENATEADTAQWLWLGKTLADRLKIIKIFFGCESAG